MNRTRMNTVLIFLLCLAIAIPVFAGKIDNAEKELIKKVLAKYEQGMQISDKEFDLIHQYIQIQRKGNIVYPEGFTKQPVIALEEHFTTGALPVGWQNVDNVASGEVWEFNNPGTRTSNTTTAGDGFAIFDSDNWGSGTAAEDADMVSPYIDCSALEVVKVQFEHYFRAGFGGYGELFVSGDSGATWVSLDSWAASSTANAELAEYDVSAVAAGQTGVMVKWNWQGDYSWYWIVDDVFVYQPGRAASYVINPFINAGNPGGLNGDSDSATSGWTSITPASQSGNSWSPVQALPFAFNFYGAAVTHYKVSQNGLVTFDTTTALLPDQNENLPSANLPDYTICAFWDTVTATPPTGTNDYIYVKEFGTAPNRQLWMKWHSMEMGSPVLSYAYWGLVLEESSNNIYVVDYNYHSDVPVTATIGIQMDNMNAVQFGTDTLNFGAGTSTNSDNSYYKIHIPWDDDIGVTNVDLAYSGFYLGVGTTVTLSAVIQNFSPNFATDFDVSYMVEDGTNDAVTYSDTLQVGEMDTITFTTLWTPAFGDTFDVTATTSLIGDGNVNNDATTLSTKVFGEVLNYSQDFEEYSGNPATIGWFGANDSTFGTFTPNLTNDGSWTSDDFGNDPALTDAARFNFYSTSSDDKDWLISPPMDMTTAGPGNMLMFDVAVTPYTGTDSTFITDDDTLFVVYSTDGTTWDRANVLDYFTAADTIPPTGWSREYNMDAYNTETNFFIGFLAMDPPSAGDINLYIDNFFMGVPPSVDVAVSNLLGLPQSVLPSTMVDFDVVISSVGQDSSFADTVDVWVNGAVVNSYEYAAMAAGESDTIAASFTASASAGTDVLAAALRMVAGDPNQTNDTLVANVDIIPPMVAPFFEDFETGVVGTPGTLPTGWTNDGGDDFDWYVDAGGTPSSGTGPTVDHTLGTAAGIYLFTESSTPNYPFFTANVTSPWIDVSGLTSPALTFWFHMHGAAQGEIHVDVWDGTTWYLDVRNPVAGQQQPVQTDPWLMGAADLAGYGSLIKVRIRGITGSSFTSDMAIDDIAVNELSLIPDDIAASGFNMPLYSMIPLSQPTKLLDLPVAGTFTNMGGANTGDINLAIYDDMGVMVHSDVLTGVTIPSFADSMFSFMVDASQSDSGSYTAMLFSSNFSDTVATNDTSSQSINIGDQLAYDFGNWDFSVAYSSTDVRNRIGAKFTLTDEDTLKSVTIGVGTGTATDSFSVELFTSDADTPSVQLVRIFRGTFGDVGTGVITTFDAVPMVLAPGEYWLVYDMDNQATGTYGLGADAQAYGAATIPMTFGWQIPGIPWSYWEDAGNAIFGTLTPIMRLGLSGVPGTVVPPDPSIIYADDFEAYTAGTQLTVQNSVDWQTWSATPGTGEDPFVSSTYSNSGVNSVNIITNNDLVKVMPNYTTGAYKMSFDLYVPTGTVAYFNTLQEFTPTPQWGMQVYFRAGGVGDIDGGGATAATFSYSYDTWLHNEVFVNLEKDTAEYYLDGVRVHGWKWTDGTFGTTVGPLQLGGNNFFGGGPVGTFDFYIDDYELKEVPSAIFEDNFDMYTAGTQLTVQNGVDWTTWSGTPGTGEDPFVSDAYANSSPNSVVIVQNNDLVNDFGPYVSGVYSMSMMVYIPNGQSGYYNAMSEFTLPGTFEWGMECYFDVGGGGRLFGGSSTAVPFVYTYDTWHSVEIVVDLDQDLAEFRLNGAALHQWQWTAGASGGGAQLQLDANDFFGAAATDEMYFDDYKLDTADPLQPDGIGEEIAGLPTTFDLSQNYPNPFNPTTKIKFQLPKKADVKIIIYNMLGQAVRTIVDNSVDAGYHEVVWDGLNESGSRVATGVYIYRMETEKFVKAHKMIMMK